jgi:hypothetical protein
MVAALKKEEKSLLRGTLSLRRGFAKNVLIWEEPATDVITPAYTI